ncbi:uncharacterized protein LOC116266469 [Nymphaea colorata]|nr:uncharacterized protein LOC116266469 [Nymphaea colorata]
MNPWVANECDVNNKRGYSLNTMKPFPHRRETFGAEEMRRKAKLSSRSYHFKSNDPNFTELCFSNPRASLQSVPSESVGTSYGGELKRGSIYQSSNSVRKMKNQGILENRQVMWPEFIKQSTNPTALQRRGLHSSSSSQRKATHVSRLNPTAYSRGSQDFNENVATCNKDLASPVNKPSSPERFLEVCFHPDETEHWHSVTKHRHGTGRSLKKVEPLKRVDNSTLKTGMHALPDVPEAILSSSFSLEKPTVANLLLDLDACKPKEITKSQVSPFQRMLDPFMSSKSSNVPSTSSTKLSQIRGSNPVIVNKNELLKKSLLKEFSKTDDRLFSQPEMHDHSTGSVQVLDASPAHLHGRLKMTYKHGAPCFQFTLKDHENVLAAKTHKTDNPLNWLYTFLSSTDKKRSSGSWGRKDGYRESFVIGQMKVSCHLCSKMRNQGPDDAYAITEFVLFDSSSQRKSLALPEGGSSSSPSRQCHETPERTTIENMVVRSPSCGHDKPSRIEPLDDDNNVTAPTSSQIPLHSLPHLQIAAMVIEVPLGKRECLKGNLKDDIMNCHRSQHLSSSSTINHNTVILDADNTANITLVIPSGIHGLPTSEATCPSPLLNRWKSGGGCDCGGWDMACPLMVFDNYGSHNFNVFPFERNNQHLELFAQGCKEKVPTLTIDIIDKWLYSVTFHAKLSSLQAFAICVAVLHSSEISMPAGKENIHQRSVSNSLKALLEEDVKCLIGMDLKDGKRKTSKRLDLQTNFMLDPPISPIGRV